MACEDRMDGHTAAIGALPDADVPRRILRLQILTVAWMSIEAIVALAAAWSAKSSALLGFGGDSAVELLSAIAFRCCGLRAPQFWISPFRILRGQTDLRGDYSVNRRSHRHAVAGRSEAEARSASRECFIASGCYGICALRLPLAYRLGRIADERDLPRGLGRPDRCFGSCPAYRERSMASREYFASLLCLIRFR